MFYGVVQSTDMRCRGTKILKFSSRKGLVAWLNAGGGEFTHENPQEEQNYHHDLRYGYELNGWVNRKDAIFSNFGSPTYKKTENDQFVDYLQKYGKEVVA